MNRLFIVISSILCSYSAVGQQLQDNSPYTRYGIGNLSNAEFMQYNSMGGVSVMHNNAYHFNLNNPASLGRLEFADLEGGFYVRYSEQKSGGYSAHHTTGNLSHFALGFPLFNPMNEIGQKKKRAYKIGFGLGLVPHSTLGYDITKETKAVGIPGTITGKYFAQGGMYKVFSGVGAKYKGFSGGIQFGYIFGKNFYSRTASLDADSITYPFQDVFTTDYSLSALSVKAGVQYEYVFTKKKPQEEQATFVRKNKLRLLVGASYTPTQAARINSGGSYVRYQQFYGLDTVSSYSKKIERATLPSELSGGFALRKDNEWQIGVQYDATAWSNYKNPAKPDSLQNTMALRIGGEYTPDHRSIDSYWKRVSYRAGFKYVTDPRVISGKQLSGQAVTAGLGLPVRLPFGLPAAVHVGVELGQQGNTALIKEQYARFGVGFTLNDNSWFYKPKFN